MRLLHVHDRAEFQGGVEQILFDTAKGLAARGWPQALLSQQSSQDPEYIRPFEYTAADRSIIRDFQPDHEREEDALFSPPPGPGKGLPVASSLVTSHSPFVL